MNAANSQLRVLAEVVHHGPVRPPAEGLREPEPVAVEGTQFDDAEAVELRETLDALRLAQAVVAADLVQRPLVENAELVGRQAIVSLNRYLERQRLAEQLPDVQRREELSYDTALARLAKSVCPGLKRLAPDPA